MKKFMVPALAGLLALGAFSHPTAAAENLKQPKIVVGIVVDQMRYDFIYRYWNKYGSGGFKRLVGSGAFYRNAEYNYVPTYTGPGHASIFTGATPAVHGIVGNSWYDRFTRKSFYCVADDSVAPVGVGDAEDGKMSPKNLLTTTVTDELRLAHDFRPKVFGISLKDRAAILPAGHLANGAYWFDDKSGSWITSMYYIKSGNLPEWVAGFNTTNSSAIANYLSALPGEGPGMIFPSETNRAMLRAKFHPTAGRPASYGAVRNTPRGNSMTEEFAEAVVTKEGLGTNDVPDFLTVNFASTDYVGHQYGPRSPEVEDTYREFDQTLAKFLSFLTDKFGSKHVLVFLTADHGVADVPKFAISNHLPGGIFNRDGGLKKLLAKRLGEGFGEGLFLGYADQQVYLNDQFINTNHLDRERIADFTREFVLRMDGVEDVLSVEALKQQTGRGFIYEDPANGINPRRSGDIVILLQSGWLESSSETGTTHGTAYTYDTHVPILFWGWHVPKLVSDEPVTTTEIAPTLSQMLRIQFPSGSTSRILPGILKYYR